MKVIEINDFEDTNLDVYARMPEVQLLRSHEPAPGMFIAESPKVVERALKDGYQPISMLISKKDLEDMKAAAVGTTEQSILRECESVPIYTAEEDVLKQLTGFQLVRGMLCAMRRKELRTIEEICAGARRIAILEDVVNPTNVGAIFRSAAALNIDAVILTKACSDPLYRRACRVSMGTVFQIPWTIFDKKTEWPGQGMELLHNLGFKTAAMALTDDSVSITDENLLQEEKLAIILGTEGDGLSAETIEQSDYTVKIPMSHGVDSLNVAAAAAVMFWQLGQMR